MSTVRHQDIDVRRQPIDDVPGEVSVGLEQHPQGGLRATFAYEGARWELEVATHSRPVVERVYREGDLVGEPPNAVESIAISAVRQLRA